MSDISKKSSLASEVSPSLQAVYTYNNPPGLFKPEERAENTLLIGHSFGQGYSPSA